MDRRRFLLTSLAGALVVPLAAGAQQGTKPWRIGVPSTADGPEWEAFRHYGDSITFLHRSHIAELALKARLPTIHLFKPTPIVRPERT
jgi:hypothetical protein